MTNTIKSRPGYAVLCIAGLLEGKAATLRDLGGEAGDASCDIQFLAEQLRAIGSDLMESLDSQRQELPAAA